MPDHGIAIQAFDGPVAQVEKRLATFDAFQRFYLFGHWCGQPIAANLLLEGRCRGLQQLCQIGTLAHVGIDVPNYLDTDDDGDGIRTILEDSTGNGPLDDDSDFDGIADFLDNVDNGRCGDPDGDGIPTGVEDDIGLNSESDDTDGDGVSDSDELGAAALDLFTDTVYCASDTFHDEDGNGVADVNETIVDTDGDDIPDVLDTDDDGDGISTSVEGSFDVDGDGIPNHLDSDSDGDGIEDSVEGTSDSDSDGVPDFLDNTDNQLSDGITDSGNSGSDSGGENSGCGGCANTSAPSGAVPGLLLGLALMLRRRRHSA